MRTSEEKLQECRVNRGRLWEFPYDGLKFWTRVWRHGFTQYQALRRYEQSSTLRVIVSALQDEITTLRSQALTLMGTAERHIVEIVRDLPEWKEWAKYVSGVGEVSLGKLLGYTGNPAARELFSSFARHCGVAVVNGRIEKPQKGQHRPYNALAKSQLWLIVNSVIKAYPRSPNLYGEIYYLSREKFARKHPDWTKMHIHLASIIRTARLFLSHLWSVCRWTQGLPVRKPYPIEYWEHTVIIPFEMALHPVKRRDEVVAAMSAVEPLLKTEWDEDVVKEMRELLERMERHTAGEKSKPRKRR